MIKLLAENIRLNLIFYRRNRLVTIVGVLFLLIMLLTAVPSIFFTSSNQRFQIVMQVYRGIVTFLIFMSGLLGLIAVWSHRSNKSVKLVFTRPCPPAIWLAGHYLSMLLVFCAGLVVALLLYGLLSLVWGIPLQVGILASALLSTVTALLVFSYMMLLSAWMHPLVAGFIGVVISEGMFYWLAILCESGLEHLKGVIGQLFLTLLHWIFHGLYYVLPTFLLFSESLRRVSSSLRLPDDWGWYLLGNIGYAALFVAFTFVLVCLRLRRSRMN